MVGMFLWGAIVALRHAAGPPHPSVAGIEWQRRFIKEIRSKTESGVAQGEHGFASTLENGARKLPPLAAHRGRWLPSDDQGAKHWSIRIAMTKEPMKKQFIISIMTA